MNLKINQPPLAEKLTEANRFTAGKTHSPLLSGIYLQAQNNKLIIRSSTGAVTYQTTLPCQLETEGHCVIPADLFLSTIKALDLGEIQLIIENDTLQIKQQSSVSQMAILPPDDFPTLNLEENKQKLVLPVESFVEYGRRVTIAASNDETKPVLTSLVLEMSQPNALVTTDGFRLFRVQVDLSLNEDGQFLLPAKVLKDFFSIVEKKDLSTIECLTSEARQEIIFNFNDTQLQVSSIQGQFPNYQAIIPQNTAFSYQVVREDLLGKVQQAMIFAKEFSSIVIFEVDISDSKDPQLKISSQASVKGQTKTFLSCHNVEGEPVQFACNGRYLLDFLNSMECEEIRIQGNDSLKPVILTNPESDQFLYLVMPFKLQE